ncbi:EcoRII N-terminal effector-binding domain-containing protein [Pseudarthrobacter oxydans]|uniref:EcoRII N-terminal effector-binding domain-containing protein n=1 Tax=Pseudarthrobacter oxydans TaxID=1671 RepID=UPI00344D4223
MIRLGEVRKVLSANDLGLTGSHQAGIAIPKDRNILSFFPPLDSMEYNPDCILTVATPQTGHLWDLRFVYYNSKLHGQGTRNEYRLTGTTRMLRELSASVGDLIRFRRSQFGDIDVTVQERYGPILSPPTERILSNGWRMTISDPED